MSNFTPGPWLVFKPESYEGPISLPGLGVDSASGEAVVWYAADPETGLRNDDDAYLIAAAPEMLTALQKVVMDSECDGMSDETRQSIASALSKATGAGQ